MPSKKKQTSKAGSKTGFSPKPNRPKLARDVVGHPTSSPTNQPEQMQVRKRR
jgi:hypothetical protein